MNRFDYTLYFALLDLTELGSGALDIWPLFSSRTPWALTSALERDHFIHGTQQQSLEDRVRVTVEQQTGIFPSGPIRMLTGLRVLGVEFNPVSFFFAYASDGITLEFVIAEVNNIPWLEQHTYVLTPEQISVGEQTSMRRFNGHPKAFHVSPFIDMSNITYSWLISDPLDNLHMKIGLDRNNESFFITSLNCARHRFSGMNLVKFQVTHPVQSAKVIMAIMWEAGKLFRRGVEFVPHPAEAETWASKAIAFVVRNVMSAKELIRPRRVVSEHKMD